MGDFWLCIGIAAIIVAVAVGGNTHAAVEHCLERKGIPTAGFLTVDCTGYSTPKVSK